MKRFIDWLLGLEKDKCDHRFTNEEVIDLNKDPKCSYCGKYFEIINTKGDLTFEWDPLVSKFRLVKLK